MADKILEAFRKVANRRHAFTRQLGDFRKKTPVTQFDSLISKARRARPGGDNGLIPDRARKLQDFRVFGPLTGVSFLQEIHWVSSQLKDLKKKISSHLDSVNALVAAFNEGNLLLAEEIIDGHVRSHGVSLWSFQAYIACYSRSESGGEKIADLLEEVQRAAPKSVLAFLTYQLSDLYNEKSSMAGFERRLEPHLQGIKSSPLSNFLQFFLRWKFDEVDCLSDYLCFCSAYSYVDAYESLVAVSIAAQCFSSDLVDHVALCAATRPLLVAGDLRIVALHRANLAQINDPDFLQRIDTNNFPDIEKVFLLAFGYYKNSNIESVALTSTERQLLEVVENFVDGSGEAEACYHQLHSFISKNRFLPWADSIASWLEGFFRPALGDEMYVQYRSSSMLPPVYGAERHELFARSLPWAAIYSSFSDVGNQYISISSRLSAQDKELMHEEVLSLTCPSDLPRHGIELLKISAMLACGDIGAALSLSVDLAVRNPGFAFSLPFEDIFSEEDEWADLAGFDPIDRLIGLYFASAGERESRRRFNLEFACKKILAENKCFSLVELLHKFESSKKIIFVIREIMTSKNLRLVGFLRTVEDIERSRLDVCANLLDLDKENIDSILGEMREILQGNDIKNAERDIENIRIHVDVDSIKKWARDTYAEEYLRLRKTRIAKIAPSVSELEESLRNIDSKNGEVDSRNKSEIRNKDPIFSMGSAIFTKCFIKEDDGLDHFLSLRIRHGSLAGYLRAPLERQKIVGQGLSIKGDELSRHWYSSLSSSNEDCIEGLLQVFESFQKKFDEMVEDLRTERLQVKSEVKPSGLFTPGIPGLAWDVFHAEWESAKSFDEFFDSVWEAFQAALNLSLGEVQAYIDTNVLRSSEEMFNNLRFEVNACGLSDNDRAKIISAINEATRGLQEAIKMVKAWFEVREHAVSDTTLSFSQILELGLKLFAKARPNYEILFSDRTKDEEVHFASSYIPRITDALFIIFDNVYQHSGLTKQAVLDLNVSLEPSVEDNGLIEISVASPISMSKDLGEIQRNLDDIKARISNRSSKELVTEGKSGLIKLARVANGIGANGGAKFEVTADRKFRVELQFAGKLRSLVED
ncbi:hypothetical protein [Herbaspirillum sp.]|uniref:hypothetical protein n=1 Tax=Herbaspirillum sp. TaxID=1890675 RepID=UPI001B29C4A7|nr:hypothetical protein [Herbaspirillum sp.]MBO9537346.1 hypothetical protein [Herbaspirillum sp.]